MTTELLVNDLTFGEGPRWHEGRLWFSDFFDHAVQAVDLDGNLETIVEVPGRPSGLGWLPDGRLLVVSMVDRRLLRMDADGLVVHAELGHLATFHCNDMVVDESGRAYVGNFGFDLDHAFASRPREDVFADHPTAVLARVDPDGSVHVAATELGFPNGAVITPDARTMIIAETLGSRLTAFDIGTDGSLTNRREWASLPRAAPDGICLNADGHVWVADPNGSQCILVAEGGEIIDRIATDRSCYACMLGGDDGRTLFLVTASSSLPEIASTTRGGQIVMARVATPAAGRP
jgi:sugar lactone lactonase YvrE